MYLRASRFVFPAVLALLPILLSACSHGEKPRATVPGDWSAMAPLRHPTPGIYLSIHELESQSGFKLVLPSYLPYGMMGYIATWEEDDPGDEQSFRASVTVPHNPYTKGSLQIEVTEWQRQQGDLADDQEDNSGTGSAILFWQKSGEENMRIGDASVTCYPEPQYFLQTPPPPLPEGLVLATPAPGEPREVELICSWDTQQLHVQVSFSWTVTEPIPGLISTDMRDEAMRVVTSMIEDPYVP
ncbi:MAG: hypothetical protein MUP15_02820 [Dehalococcoidia bacterium]|jgi:hypothetical protein|nr:hypothetical protein [Dehalococcoidia bacterium]